MEAKYLHLITDWVTKGWQLYEI